MTDAFLRGLLEEGDEVPIQIVKFNQEIKDLDKTVNKLMDRLKEKTMLYTKNQKKFTRDAKLRAAKEIDAMYKEAEAASAKKVEIAKEMYDYIDAKIQELDTKTTDFNQRMARKNAEEQRKLAGSAMKASTSGGGGGGRGDKRKRKGQDDPKQARLNETAEFVEDFKPIQIQQMDMPVNPNEPRYCICHQVSFGEMVGCDNPTCKYEWFHMQCIKMTSVPAGNWICDYCKASKDKKK